MKGFAIDVELEKKALWLRWRNLGGNLISTHCLCRFNCCLIFEPTESERAEQHLASKDQHW